MGKTRGAHRPPSEATPSLPARPSQVTHQKGTHHKLVAVLLGPILIGCSNEYIRHKESDDAYNDGVGGVWSESLTLMPMTFSVVP